ncbi:hypothetical protein CDAR_265141 [Caerostris darwini]|uniref:Uncharacterized protein n=1 Tax=Caerostris darwini TaxID=1538125 RepID=A0AAV4W3H2_9ARAC|nr:hypothetical protein CDAR_265141 [Caerostris darwini]
MHAQGYRYCSSGTDVAKQDQARGPTNELDRLCRPHDIQVDTLGRILSASLADKIPTVCAENWLARKCFCRRAKQNFRDLPRRKWLSGEDLPSPHGDKKKLLTNPSGFQICHDQKSEQIEKNTEAKRLKKISTSSSEWHPPQDQESQQEEN